MSIDAPSLDNLTRVEPRGAGEWNRGPRRAHILKRVREPGGANTFPRPTRGDARVGSRTRPLPPSRQRRERLRDARRGSPLPLEAAPRRRRSTELSPRTSRAGSPISCRRRGSIGIGITGCFRPITACGKPSRRSRSGALVSGPRLRPAGMRPAGPGPIRQILEALGDPLVPPPLSPARDPPTDWGELVQVHDDREAIQATPDELPAIDTHSL